MIQILKWVWQFPQNLIGFILSRKYYLKSRRKTLDGQITVYFKDRFFRSGVSLGDYVILDSCYIGMQITQTVCHEHGHQKQSLMLGWFYLLLIGLPSVCRNVWDRWFHRKWTSKERESWYYRGYPERWADVLGGVIRD